MQKTINSPFSVSGITLHNGVISNLTIYPATANTALCLKGLI